MAGCQIDGLAGRQPPGTAAHGVPQEQPLPVLSSPGGAGDKPAGAVAVPPPSPPPSPPNESGPAKEASLDIDPDRVLGLDRPAVEALLGEPDFVRRENPMELWRYRHEECAVALFLYAEEPGGRGPLRVRHVEAWAPGAEETPPGACLSALARRAGRTPTG